MVDRSMSDSVKGNQMDTLNAQITQVHAEMAEAGKDIGKQTEVQ